MLPPSAQRIFSAQESDSSKTLGVIMNGKPITTKQYFPRAETYKAPEISFAVPNPAATYLVVTIDPDAPFQSMPVLAPILHWIQPGFTKTNPSGDDSLTSTSPFVADWHGAGPPPGSGPHRYVFLLFEQPAGFDASKWAPADGKPMGFYGRIRFDLDGWLKKAGLGEPIAVNYFTSN